MLFSIAVPLSRLPARRCERVVSYFLFSSQRWRIANLTPLSFQNPLLSLKIQAAESFSEGWGQKEDGADYPAKTGLSFFQRTRTWYPRGRSRPLQIFVNHIFQCLLRPEVWWKHRDVEREIHRGKLNRWDFTVHPTCDHLDCQTT